MFRAVQRRQCRGIESGTDALCGLDTFAEVRIRSSRERMGLFIGGDFQRVVAVLAAAKRSGDAEHDPGANPMTIDLDKRIETLTNDNSSLLLAIDTALDLLKSGDAEEARRVLERAKSRAGLEKQS